jgi:hypothetical protein
VAKLGDHRSMTPAELTRRRHHHRSPGIGGGRCSLLRSARASVVPSPRDKDSDRAGRKINSESTTSESLRSAPLPCGRRPGAGQCARLAVALASNLADNLTIGLIARSAAQDAHAAAKITSAVLIGVDLAPND